MLSLPRPRSSKLTTRAPSLFTLEVAEWNFGAPAQAAVASARTATSVAVVTAILRKDARMVLPSVGVRARAGAGARGSRSVPLVTVVVRRALCPNNVPTTDVVSVLEPGKRLRLWPEALSPLCQACAIPGRLRRRREEARGRPK